MPLSAPLLPRRAERWVTEAGTADVATLDIPADAQHDRVFEISCRYVVAHRGAPDAWHSLRIDVDGRQEWSRRLSTENPGSTDSLDYRFLRQVPAGQPLRVTAKTGAHRVSRLELLIEADEELG